MKTKLIIFLLILMSLQGFSQSKKELLNKIDSITIVKDTYKTIIDSLRTENEKLKAVLMKIDVALVDFKNQNTQGISNTSQITNEQKTTVEKKQCKAITQSGTQCSRNAEDGSDYCWQHKPQTSTSPTPTPKSSSSSYGGSRTIQTGPRGGQYYINSNGKKTYVKRK